jgi:hypothetical protein
MAILWILGILAVLLGAGVFVSRRRDAGMNQVPAPHVSAAERGAATRAKRARRNAASGGGYIGYFGDVGGGFGGGFDGGGCGGGDGGGGGSC